METVFQAALTRAYNAIISHITRKADKTGGVSQITDSNSANYTIIGSLSSYATQQTINSAINTKLGTCLTSHQDISGKVNTSDIADNLTTNNASKVLSAKQGKILQDEIDDILDGIHDIIYGTGGS